MRARRTALSNFVYRLGGGTEDNDLHVQRCTAEEAGEASDSPVAGMPAIVSVWEPSPEERAALACGANVELRVIGDAQPPVSINVTREQPLSRPQHTTDDPAAWLELTRVGFGDVLIALRQSAPHLGAARRDRLAVFVGHLEGLAAELDALDRLADAQ